MGGPTDPPIIIESIDDWRAFRDILDSSAFDNEADQQWVGTNFVGPVGWAKSGGNYKGSFDWCGGDRVSWDYTPPGSVTVSAQAAPTCPVGGPNRLPSRLSLDFLRYVLGREDKALVDPLSSEVLNDFGVSESGSDYTLDLEYDDDGTTVTRTASATWSSGQWTNYSVS